jgi:hypothetical protein
LCTSFASSRLRSVKRLEAQVAPVKSDEVEGAQMDKRIELGEAAARR